MNNADVIVYRCQSCGAQLEPVGPLCECDFCGTYNIIKKGLFSDYSSKNYCEAYFDEDLYIPDHIYKEKLQKVFDEYGINASIEYVLQSSFAVTFAVQPGSGVRINSITKYKDEYVLTLGGKVSFDIPLKGTSYLGLQLIKNTKRRVSFEKLIKSKEFQETESRIPLLMGVSVLGKPIVEDLDQIGHLIIGGDQGSGKSMFLNNLLLGMISKVKPEDVRIILIDIEGLNLNTYGDLPWLACPVISTAHEAEIAIKYCFREVNERIHKIASYACKDLDDYNDKSDDVKLPHLVVIIDEIEMLLSDINLMNQLSLVLSSGDKTGVHTIITTHTASGKILKQIKDYIGARISFSFIHESYSRFFLDSNVAHRIANSGEMYYKKALNNTIMHIQTADISDKEIFEIQAYNKAIFARQMASEGISKQRVCNSAREETKDYYKCPPEPEIKHAEDGRDEYFEAAARLVIEKEKGSIGMLQRYYKIGFNRAAGIMDQLEEAGVVGPEEDKKPRRVLMTIEEFERLL